MKNKDRALTLTPSWTHYFWYYLFGVLLIPVGLGLLLIWVALRRQKSLNYIITDHDITVEEGSYSQTLKLADIRSTKVRQNKTQQWFGIGNLLLEAHESSVILEGVKNPGELKQKIDLAVEYERKRIEASRQAQPKREHPKPGSMDRMDTLTGLWQQGLLSDEDYQNERKKFEG